MLLLDFHACISAESSGLQNELLDVFRAQVQA